MNRYQLEVAEMDRRHRMVVRALSFIGAATLMLVALWSAGFPPSGWWARVYGLFDETNDEPPAAQATPATSLAAATIPPGTAPAMDQEGIAGTDSSISATPQPLYLVATSPGRNKTEGTAQIGTSPENPQTYVGGALLGDGVRLAEIHADRVVLQKGHESLTLYVSADRAASLGERSRGAEQLGFVGGRPAALPAPMPPTREGLVAVVRAAPVYENDSLSGIRVFPGQKSGVFAQLGLEPGDLILAIDGAAVVDARTAIDLLETLTDGAAVTVSVQRDAEIRVLALDGSVIAEALRTPDSARPQETVAAAPPI